MKFLDYQMTLTTAQLGILLFQYIMLITLTKVVSKNFSLSKDLIDLISGFILIPFLIYSFVHFGGF